MRQTTLKLVFAMATLIVAAALIPADPAPAAPKKRGGGETQYPSIITFRDGGGDGLLSDGLGNPVPAAYTHGEQSTQSPNGDLRAYVGAKTNGGNLFLIFSPDNRSPGVAVRGLKLDLSNPVVPPDSGCNLPSTGGSDPRFIVPDFLIVDINDETSGGAPALENVGDSSFANMRMRLFQAAGNGDAYFLYFNTVNGNDPCQGQWDQVSVSRTKTVANGGKDEWEVTWHDNVNAKACLAKSGNGKNAKFCGVYNLPGRFWIETINPLP